MADELSRKRRQRGGHRSTTTRIISSVIENLGAGEISRFNEHAVKLRQQRASIEEKLVILVELDVDILAHMAEDEIEGEIERQDLFKENVRLAIANIDNALSTPEVVSHTAHAGKWRSHQERLVASKRCSGQFVTSVSTLNKTQVKLPKLELKKFDGDQSKWSSFWDTFEASMHDNSSILMNRRFSQENWGMMIGS